jgi:hypothetical protein
MTTINQGEELRAKVFEICENLYKNNEKINRDVVREKLGGGSFSTICPIIKEWRESRFVQSEEEESTTSNIIKAETSEITESPEELKVTSINSEFIPDHEMEGIMESSAKAAFNMHAAKKAMTTHFYQNPDLLPPELKARLEVISQNFTLKRSNTDDAAYDSQNLINIMMNKLKKKQDDLKLIG